MHAGRPSEIHPRAVAYTVAIMTTIVRLSLLLSMSLVWLPLSCAQPAASPETTTAGAATGAATATADEGPPVIGLTGYVDLPGTEAGGELGKLRVTRTYRDALVRAGAVPVHLLPVPADRVGAALDHVDGLVMCGGPDIDPAAYGEQRHESVETMPTERQDFDMAVAREAMARRMPLLGICLGSQEINVARGGAMIQDLPTEVGTTVGHRELAIDDLRQGVHDITLVPDSRLAALYGGAETIRVNSAHHQASDVLAEGLVAAAHAPDGVIEAFVDPALPLLIGVQFHPEIQTEPAGQHDPLFEALVEAAREYRRR
jgi:putative glutamine amidotransferase